jgi:NAD(P)-dependent dehydrogenase (short-subunit alcohol dehydrogenase family)
MMSEKHKFEGKVVLVTGGNSGIGLATAKEFIAEGAKVLITGRDQTNLDRAKKELGSNLKAIKNDAGKLSETDRLVDFISKEYGRLDVAFINAGIAQFGPQANLDESAFDDTFNTNVKGPYFLIKGLVPLFRNGGSVILNGTINAHIGMPGSSIYAASKAALISFARTLSAEYVGQGIRINVVSPGPIKTPIFERLGLPPDALQQMAAGIQAKVPMKRFGTPEEIAKTVLFLASSDSSFIIGTEIIVDGGMTEMIQF